MMEKQYCTCGKLLPKMWMYKDPKSLGYKEGLCAPCSSKIKLDKPVEV